MKAAQMGQVKGAKCPLEEVKGSHVNNVQLQRHWAIIVDKPQTRVKNAIRAFLEKVEPGRKGIYG